MLVRVSVVGGPSERKLPPRALQEVSSAFHSFRPGLNLELVQFILQVKSVSAQKKSRISFIDQVQKYIINIRKCNKKVVTWIKNFLCQFG